MLKLDVLRLFVDQRLSAATDDIFRRLAATISDYEGQLHRLQRQVHRQQRLLAAAGRPEETPEETPEDGQGVLQVFRPLKAQQVRGRGFGPHIRQEEGGASRPEGAGTKSSQNPDWLMGTPETDQTRLSNRIQSCRDHLGPGPDVHKQEVVEGHMLLDISSQQEGVLQVFTTQEQQVRRRSFNLHIRREESRPGSEEDTEFTQSPDWLMESYRDDPSSNHIQSLREDDLAPSDPLMKQEPGGTRRPADLSWDSIMDSESSTEDSDDAQLGPDRQRTGGAQPPADQKPLVCGSCGREFSSKRTLRRHVRQNKSVDQDQMSCSLRRQRAPFQSPVKSFSCRVCGIAFHTLGILVRHAENHCKEPASRCGACGDHLESTETLRDHLRSHKELGRTCEVCGKKCSSIRRMEIHKRVHTGEKPYSCVFCSRDFSRKESLERHLKVHSGDRPHTCGVCGTTFTRREYLVVHHLRTGHAERHGSPAGEAGGSKGQSRPT
ncbi:zinc finger protein 391-like [Pempheris klunzingeri]|uniref:zinc finger protein 391-like n=1 Tax=Pempheris klunzingeri TaxID=3127111 RepID=UPI003981887A